MAGCFATIYPRSLATIGIFRKKLAVKKKKLCPYDRELDAVYEAVHHFRHVFEGRYIIIYTDKALVYAFSPNIDRTTPWQFRRLDYIGQFTTDLEHVAGQDNVVADVLSRAGAIFRAVSTSEIIEAQKTDTEIEVLLKDSGALNLQRYYSPR